MQSNTAILSAYDFSVMYITLAVAKVNYRNPNGNRLNGLYHGFVMKYSLYTATVIVDQYINPLQNSH